LKSKRKKSGEKMKIKEKLMTELVELFPGSMNESFYKKEMSEDLIRAFHEVLDWVFSVDTKSCQRVL